MYLQQTPWRAFWLLSPLAKLRAILVFVVYLALLVNVRNYSVWTPSSITLFSLLCYLILPVPRAIWRAYADTNHRRFLLTGVAILVWLGISCLWGIKNTAPKSLFTLLRFNFGMLCLLAPTALYIDTTISFLTKKRRKKPKRTIPRHTHGMLWFCIILLVIWCLTLAVLLIDQSSYIERLEQRIQRTTYQQERTNELLEFLQSN